MLSKEVANLRSLPAGPKRKAACAKPRRLSWDAVASIQASLMPLDDLSEGTHLWQQSRAREAFDCCTDLTEILSTVQACERETMESTWALTEYAVLSEEIEAQLAKAQRILSLFEGSEEEDQEEVSEQVGKADSFNPPTESTRASLDTVDDLGASPDVNLSSIPAGCPGATGCSHFEPKGSRSASKSSCCSSAVQVHQPVRLRVEDLDDLEDDYYACKHAQNGMCEAGCTVGGCQAALVEAW